MNKDSKLSRRQAAFWLALAPAFAGFSVVQGAQAPAGPGGGRVKLPKKEGSFRFAVMGDTGRGDSGQYQMAKMMETVYADFPFTTMIMVGDNIYGADTADDMKRKFDIPYKPLIDAGVKFQASIGNHDNPNQRFYKPFNMGGNRFYTFRPEKTNNIRFFVLDSNYIDKEQLDWLEKELSASQSDWKIAYFHHPLYSSGGTHGSALESRAVLEPLFVKHNVSAVFTGHDHFYERIKPQKGEIVHWVSGAGGSLRRGDIRRTDMTAKGFDTDYHFMICEIAGDEMSFQAIARTGESIDSGVIKRLGPTSEAVIAPIPKGSPDAPGTKGSSSPAPSPAGSPAEPAAPVAASPVAPKASPTIAPF